MIIVLLITAFFYGKPPEVAAVITEDVQTCQTLGAKAKAGLEAQGDVQVAEYACFAVKEANKT